MAELAPLLRLKMPSRCYFLSYTVNSSLFLLNSSSVNLPSINLLSIITTSIITTANRTTTPNITTISPTF